VKSLSANGLRVFDFGVEDSSDSVDYPDYAHKVTDCVLNTAKCFGMLVCHSGIGMAMSANRHKRIRAAWCDRCELAVLSREHNDANVLCIGSAFVNPELAIGIANVFMTTSFAGGRHVGRIEKIDAV
jgi:ribose 5-phosphate isomerase B